MLMEMICDADYRTKYNFDTNLTISEAVYIAAEYQLYEMEQNIVKEWSEQSCE